MIGEHTEHRTERERKREQGDEPAVANGPCDADVTSEF